MPAPKPAQLSCARAPARYLGLLAPAPRARCITPRCFCNRMVRVAIVGAGFAGLSLARALQRCDAFEVVVFEVKREDSCDVICGCLHLPSAGGVLSSLGLEDAWLKLDSGDAAAEVEFKGLRRALVRSLRESTVRWGTRVTGISTDAVSGVRLRTSCATVGPGSDRRHRWSGDAPRGEETWSRPFDVVVAADGWRSVVRDRAGGLPKDAPVAAIGDARWIWGRWWDFGYARVQRGGDAALTDGTRLAAQLLESRHDTSWHRACLGEFAVDRGERTRARLSKAAVAAVVVAGLARLVVA